MTLEDAAERYATGNHRVSFADTSEKKAFLAGYAFAIEKLRSRVVNLGDNKKKNPWAYTAAWLESEGKKSDETK